MVAMRSKAKAPIPHTPEKPISPSEDVHKQRMSDYEQSRENRIKENLERMEKLGILDLSLKLKSLKPAPKRSTPSIRKNLHHFSPLPPPGPARRSSRLQNATPVSYSEVQLVKKYDPLEDGNDLPREEGSKPELYTEEHEKLLGSTEKSWTLFVDGYGKDGKRIYDSVKGKTCHQCRQKTLGLRTHCSKCNMVQGQFCGDCLFMRYGEHVLEANQNPNWICPVCRGICNCSLCRQAKGWPPTGTLYKKISNLGFKSVAHYLIQTRRSSTDSEANSGSKVPISVKRSLPFSNAEAASMENESSQFSIKTQGLEYPVSEGKLTDNDLDDVKEEEKAECLENEQGYCQVDPGKNSEIIMHPATNCNTENLLLLSEMGREADTHVCSNIPWENSAGSLNKLVLPRTICDQKGASETELETTVEKLEGKKVEETLSLGQKQVGCFVAPESTPKSNKRCCNTSELVTDSIAGRLRQRRKVGNACNDEMSTVAKAGNPGVKHELSNISYPGKAVATMNRFNYTTSDVTPVAVADTEHEEEPGSTSATYETSDVKQQLNNVSSSPDSIAGRLRQRHEKRAA